MGASLCLQEDRIRVVCSRLARIKELAVDPATRRHLNPRKARVEKSRASGTLLLRGSGQSHPLRGRGGSSDNLSYRNICPWTHRIKDRVISHITKPETDDEANLILGVLLGVKKQRDPCYSSCGTA